MFNSKAKKKEIVREIVIAISIIIVVVLFGSKPFTAIKERIALNESVKEIEILLEEARLHASSGFVSGVRFEEHRAILFKENLYLLSNFDNKTSYLNEGVIISEVNLAGSNSKVIFNKLKGDTDNPGKIKLVLISDKLKFKIITIFPNGTFFSE